MVGLVLDRVENILGTGENAGYQHFLLFPQCFQGFLTTNLVDPYKVIYYCHYNKLSFLFT